MSRWVDEKFEGVISFMFIAVAVFIPWNVSSASAGPYGRVLAIRWWIGEVRQVAGFEAANGWQWAWESAQLQTGNTVFPSYIIWIGASVGVLFLLGFGIALLVNEEEITDNYPVHKIAGSVFTVSGAAYVLATVHMSLNGFPGTYVPIGGGLYIVFGLILLTNRGARVTQFPAYCLTVVTENR